MDEHDRSSFHAAIEAIVIVAMEPVPVELLAQLLERPLSDIEAACEALAAEYR
ncbi:MAG TPA: segregation and condensation protein B, partial [Acidimicrobiaceae bacterium]|nr:segregation and condensation protein B [Acidimicrobiaceae bacterium]